MRFVVTKSKEDGSIGSISTYPDLNPDEEHSGDYFTIDEVEVNEGCMFDIIDAVQRQATDKKENPTVIEKLVAVAFVASMKWRS